MANRILTLCGLLAGMCVVLASCAPAGRLPDGSERTVRSNFIHNGDFARPITTSGKMLLLRQGADWSASDCSLVEWDPVHGHDAPGCLRIKGIAMGDPKPKRDRVVAPVAIDGAQATALGATTMRLSFWVRSNRPDGAASQLFLRCECFGDAPPYKLVPTGFKTWPMYNRGPGPCGQEWQECVIEDVPVAEHTVYNIHFLIRDLDSDILVDDMRFTITGTGLAP